MGDLIKGAREEGALLLKFLALIDNID